MLKIQEKNDLPRSIAIVVATGQTISLADEAARFLKRVEFEPADQGDARRLRPAGLASPVVIDPLVRFGQPSVDGVATKRLWELFEAGEAIEDITDGYDMSTDRSCRRCLRGAAALIGGRSRPWRPGSSLTRTTWRWARHSLSDTTTSCTRKVL